MIATVAAVLAEIRHPDAVARAEQLLASVCVEWPKARPDVYDVARHLRLDVLRARRWRLKHHDAMLDVVAGRDVVLVRPRLSLEREAFVVGHELGHYVLGVAHALPHDPCERWCDEFGATLIALWHPRLAV